MSDWLPEYDNALRAHFEAGLSAAMAAAQINATFGLRKSRNSVIGRARRERIPMKASQTVLNARMGKKSAHLPSSPVPILGAAPKFKRGRKPNIQRPDIAIRKANSAIGNPIAAFVPRPDPRPGAVPLLELVPDGCRYPNGNFVPYLFCNQPTSEGSYCAGHAAICFRALEPRRR